ncbi:ABC transporter ATP-binding protein [Brytella acorum]|uniref:ATP-binding cassette domain-containing protein n=1 Tax=Brytella acorum TaxID=2959299 RepID=A0AA35UHW6_9PROT|nr:ATP-binding cassette domain-containing protein [Brytella acorum]MDF3623392.1 ATP-binding cassette domain-containing protein [Brytella acorum]CAI9120499.1 ATP-binding cassette domain-containing protein [Brytella acorum]
MTALSVSHISKSFGSKLAVDDLSFSVAEGETFGFLGGNGAGKTTSLRMMLDIIPPDRGEIRVLGRPAARENATQIGFLPEERGLYRNMTALDTLIYFGRLKGLSGTDARSRGLALLERFGLSGEARKNIASFSKGMAQKVQIATALINRPRLLMLDEPFSGLDPINQALLEDEILRASREGAAVLFSTHIMQHAERLCDRLLILVKGRKRFEGTLSEALAGVSGNVTLSCRADPTALADVAEAHIAVSEHASDPEWKPWSVALKPGRTAADLLETCTREGFALRSFELPRPTLHDAFIAIAGTTSASGPEYPA